MREIADASSPQHVYVALYHLSPISQLPTKLSVCVAAAACAFFSIGAVVRSMPPTANAANRLKGTAKIKLGSQGKDRLALPHE